MEEWIVSRVGGALFQIRTFYPDMILYCGSVSQINLFSLKLVFVGFFIIETEAQQDSY